MSTPAPQPRRAGAATTSATTSLDSSVPASSSDCSRFGASNRGRCAEARAWCSGHRLEFKPVTAVQSERAAGGAAATRDSHPRTLPRRRATMPASAASARPPGAWPTASAPWQAAATSSSAPSTSVCGVSAWSLDCMRGCRGRASTVVAGACYETQRPPKWRVGSHPQLCGTGAGVDCVISVLFDQSQ